jgi:hypothetical protein
MRRATRAALPMTSRINGSISKGLRELTTEPKAICLIVYCFQKSRGEHKKEKSSTHTQDESENQMQSKHNMAKKVIIHVPEHQPHPATFEARAFPRPN